ncbi:PAS domain-containing protein cky-1-like isoform X2 [Artemia franciscana]
MVDGGKSTKGASKLRRDLINTEISNLRDLLPLQASTRQRLSQLQLMALVCVYIRKSNYFHQVFRDDILERLQSAVPQVGFTKALSGFLMMITQSGKLLYISENAADYLGHSMEDLLIHGDSVYDIIDKNDHQAVTAEMKRPIQPGATDTRRFLCRMNVSKSSRRQMRFGDQRIVIVEGHYLVPMALSSRPEPVLLAVCTPVAMPETREAVIQGACNVFTTLHSMDMKILEVDRSTEHYLGYSNNDLQNVSWYDLLHWDCLFDAQAKHKLVTRSDQERSSVLLARMQRNDGLWIWVHCVLHVVDGHQSSDQSIIIATCQVLSNEEAEIMKNHRWIYRYYSTETRLRYGPATDSNEFEGGSELSSSPQPSAFHSPALSCTQYQLPDTELVRNVYSPDIRRIAPPDLYESYIKREYLLADAEIPRTIDYSVKYEPYPNESEPRNNNDKYYNITSDTGAIITELPYVRRRDSDEN